MGTMEEILHRDEILRKSLGKQMRLVRKEAKKVAKAQKKARKAAKKKDRESKNEEYAVAEGLSLERLQKECQNFRFQLQAVLDLEATRKRVDARREVKLMVGEEVLIESIEVSLLLSLRREVEYARKLFQALKKVSEDERVEGTVVRLKALAEGIDRALEEVNQEEVKEERFPGEVADYMYRDWMEEESAGEN